MCHAIFLLPLIGLVVFWFLLLTIAVPVYLFILIPSLLVSYAMVQDMHLPVSTSWEEMVGQVRGCD